MYFLKNLLFTNALYEQCTKPAFAYTRCTLWLRMMEADKQRQPKPNKKDCCEAGIGC